MKIKDKKKYNWRATVYFTYERGRVIHKVEEFRCTLAKAKAKVERMARLADVRNPNPGGEYMPGMGVEWSLTSIGE